MARTWKGKKQTREEWKGKMGEEVRDGFR